MLTSQETHRNVADAIAGEHATKMMRPYRVWSLSSYNHIENTGSTSFGSATDASESPSPDGDKMKYPRTWHLPWSNGDSDDLKGSLPSAWDGSERLLMTEKMDGENTTVGRDYVHARSIDSGYHPSRTWVKNFAAQWQWDLAEDERICGENLHYVHSIIYDNLDSWFLGFSLWRGDVCCSWEETVERFDLYGIAHVPVIGICSATEAHQLWIDSCNEQYNEGYVLRNPDQFNVSDFSSNVRKYVRPDHVQTDSHWLNNKVAINGLKGKFSSIDLDKAY